MRQTIDAFETAFHEEMAEDRVRRDYRLSGDHRRALTEGLADGFRKVTPRTARAGDLMLAAVSASQLHLMVRTETGFVHADARRGVVETPGAPDWPILAVYRKRRNG